jgi:hypothetical protein
VWSAFLFFIFLYFSNSPLSFPMATPTHLDLANRAFAKLNSYRAALDGWTNAGKLFDLCPDASVLMLGLKAAMTDKMALIEDVGRLCCANSAITHSDEEVFALVELLKHKLNLSGLGALIAVDWEKLETEKHQFSSRMGTLSSLASLLVAAIDISQGF